VSRGFGFTQRWLLGCIGDEPMTFKEILARAYPAVTYEGDMAGAIGVFKVGGVRSLRRALGKLCDLGVIQIAGRRPHHYRLSPHFAALEHNAEAITLLCKILKNEPAMLPEGGPNPLLAAMLASPRYFGRGPSAASAALTSSPRKTRAAIRNASAR
jgi:hypothetical protein